MKAKITRSDGTVIELEGTADEIQKLIPPPSINIDWSKWLQPQTPPLEFHTYPVSPSYPLYPPTICCGNVQPSNPQQRYGSIC